MRSQLETNLYAPIAITRAVLPHLRRQGSGRILQIGSMGGRVGNPGTAIYQAALCGEGGCFEVFTTWEPDTASGLPPRWLKSTSCPLKA